MLSNLITLISTPILVTSLPIMEAPWWQGVSVIVAIVLGLSAIILPIITAKKNKRESIKPDWIFERIDISSINYLNSPITIEFKNNGNGPATDIKVEYYPDNSSSVITANFFCDNPFVRHNEILRFQFNEDFPNPTEGLLKISCITKLGYKSTIKFNFRLSLDEAKHRRIEISASASKRKKKTNHD